MEKVAVAIPAVTNNGDRVGARHVMPGYWYQFPPANYDGGQSDRHVDDKNPAPTHGYQHAADERRECGGETADSGPIPHGAGAAFGRERGKQKPDRGWRHQRGARGLYDTKSDKRRHAVGAGASGRGRREQGDAEQKAAIATITLGQPTEEHQQGGVGDRIGI
jgi:hypothetical protein